MTKTELILAAYSKLGIKPGVNIENFTDSNGWIFKVDAPRVLEHSGDLDEYTSYVRPKALRGIENNNGYKIMSVDGLPPVKGTTYLVILKANPKLAKPMVYSSEKFWLANVTHYKEDCSSLPLYGYE